MYWTLVEKAQKEVELADAEAMQKKLQEATFDFNDFVKQMRLIKRMGSLGGLIKLIPGMNKIDDGMIKDGEDQLKKIESMISSMTLRRNKNLRFLLLILREDKGSLREVDMKQKT